MKIYLKQNVIEATLERLRFVFREFKNVIVNFSGGKDSVVILNLALIIAKEENRLPLSVMFLDQEVEWQGTIDLVRATMYRDDIRPLWFQMPMVITNNASSVNRYNYCWDTESEHLWVHKKDEISIKENHYGTNRFHDLFGAILEKDYGGIKTAYVSGVRAEETPKRFVSLTNSATYQDITWGNVHSKRNEHFTFYPIYDWSYTDVWKSIHDNRWSYNKVYDAMYSYGVDIKNMRISNLHHETAIQVLMLVQEIEPQTWERVIDRIDGANTISHLKKSSFACPGVLPFMFTSWVEYAHYIVDNIVQDERNKLDLLERMQKGLLIYVDDPIKEYFCREIINTVLSSDWDWTKLTNFSMRPEVYNYRKYKKGFVLPDMLKQTKYLPIGAERQLRDKLNEYSANNS